jgi:hypothetical protein
MVLFIGVMVLSLGILPSLYAVEPPGDMQIDKIKRENHEDYKVPFSHDLHTGAGFECTQCHHMGSGQDVQSCSAAGCHDYTNVSEEMNEYYSFWRATHVIKGNETSCLSCHTDMLGTKDYTGCYESVCHDNLYFSESWFYNRVKGME